MKNTKLFRVLTVSTNANAFGLHAHILVAGDGVSYRVLRARHDGNPPLTRGDEVRVPVDPCTGGLLWARMSFECPERVDAPKAVARRAYASAV